MRQLRQRLLHYIVNLSLKRKLVCVVGICIFLLSLSGLIGSLILSKAYLRLLQETVASNLSYSSSIISQTLDRIEDMTGSLLADSVIQRNLVTANDSENPREQTIAHQALSQTVLDFYEQYKSSYVDYITLSHSRNTIYSNYLSDKRTPEEIEERLLAMADEGEGRPVWLFQYAQTNGFYLTRQIRNAQSPYFSSLGTLIVSVDLDEMISSLNQQEGAFPDTRYFIASDGQIIYHTDDTADGIFQKLDNASGDSYKILTVDGHKYFVYSTLIPGHSLTYTCYLSYDSITYSANISWFVSMVVLFFTCLIAVVFSHYTISSIDRHTNLLLKKMQAYNAEQISLPQTDPVYADRKDEFGLLNRQFDHMAERIHNLILDNYVNELWKKDAQLKALEKQIQPHFLYNTLESINWRAKSAGNQDISSMVESLGNLLRASLSKDNGGWTLKKELEITDAYITIQKYRFEEHLEYLSHCDPSLCSALLPKFMIQPLVENAVHYGLEENTEVCHIEVNVRLTETAGLEKQQEILQIFVKNDGSAFEEGLLLKLKNHQASARGFGIGLVNIDERIKLMFGGSYGLTLYNEGDLAVAQITIPYLDKTEVNSC